MQIVKESVIKMSDLYNLKITNVEPKTIDEDLFKRIAKNTQFNVYTVTTAQRDYEYGIQYDQDIVFSDVPSVVVCEAIRQSLHLPFVSNDHGWSQDPRIGYNVKPINRKDKQAPDNEFALSLKYREKLKHSIKYVWIKYFWIITSKIDSNGMYITAYKLNSQECDSSAVESFSQYRQEQIDAKKQAQESEQDFNILVGLISKMSTENKAKILKMLIK